MARLLVVLALTAVALAAIGCDSAALRPWQKSPLPTHDVARAYDAAREVMARHFRVAVANFTQGLVETRPEVIDKPRNMTLADVRGAKGRWRRTVYFEMDRDGLNVLGRVAVLIEREATAEAAAIAGTMDADARESELPRTGARYTRPPGKPAKEVWIEVGYDAALARELLSEIAEAVSRAEGDEAMPAAPSAKDVGDEIRRLAPTDRP